MIPDELLTAKILIIIPFRFNNTFIIYFSVWFLIVFRYLFMLHLLLCSFIIYYMIKQSRSSGLCEPQGYIYIRSITLHVQLNRMYLLHLFNLILLSLILTWSTSCVSRYNNIMMTSKIETIIRFCEPRLYRYNKLYTFVYLQSDSPSILTPIFSFNNLFIIIPIF